MSAVSASACPLTVIAWRLGGLTVSDLWWRCVELGGNHRRAELADYLGGTAAWSAVDHNVVAHALNEALWERGCPTMAPLRGLEDVATASHDLR